MFALWVSREREGHGQTPPHAAAECAHQYVSSVRQLHLGKRTQEQGQATSRM